MIPKQLQVPEIRFVLLEKGGKKTFQKEFDEFDIKHGVRADIMEMGRKHSEVVRCNEPEVDPSPSSRRADGAGLQ